MIGKAVARAMVAPFRCLPPLRRAVLVTPPPEPETATHLMQLRSSTAVAATIHGIGGAAEVTDTSQRLDGVVISVENHVQELGFTQVFYRGRRLAALRRRLREGLSQPL